MNYHVFKFSIIYRISRGDISSAAQVVVSAVSRIFFLYPRGYLAMIAIHVCNFYLLFFQLIIVASIKALSRYATRRQLTFS